MDEIESGVADHVGLPIALRRGAQNWSGAKSDAEFCLFFADEVMRSYVEVKRAAMQFA